MCVSIFRYAAAAAAEFFTCDVQTCTERQYPPAVVAQVLDYAVTSLHPRCPQNVGMYREIQMCMGRIKTQILALVPT